jgi:hypothetical protein
LHLEMRGKETPLVLSDCVDCITFQSYMKRTKLFERYYQF